MKACPWSEKTVAIYINFHFMSSIFHYFSVQWLAEKQRCEERAAEEARRIQEEEERKEREERERKHQEEMAAERERKEKEERYESAWKCLKMKSVLSADSGDPSCISRNKTDFRIFLSNEFVIIRTWHLPT